MQMYTLKYYCYDRVNRFKVNAISRCSFIGIDLNKLNHVKNKYVFFSSPPIFWYNTLSLFNYFKDSNYYNKLGFITELINYLNYL